MTIAWGESSVSSFSRILPRCNEKPMVTAISTLKAFHKEGVVPEAFLTLTDDDRYIWLQQGRCAMDINDFGSSNVYNDPKQSKVPNTWKTAPFPITKDLKSKFAYAPAPIGGWVFAWLPPSIHSCGPSSALILGSSSGSHGRRRWLSALRHWGDTDTGATLTLGRH